MKMSGSIRRTERKTRRSVATRESPPLFFAFQDATAHPGPGAHLSGPGSFFLVGLSNVFCTARKPAPSQRTFTSYLIPLERKARLRTMRSDSYE
jgi:hypothetical protein